MHAPPALLGLLGLGIAVGCSGGLPASSMMPASPDASLPSAASRCESSSPPRHPIVTEWPASEKSHLQSLASERLVAVSYSGCELRVIPECRLDGGYEWVQTTAATDTMDIDDADELYAKLPIGAVGLEGELKRSGRLAVQTTVVGQLRALAKPSPTELGPNCQAATHLVTAISIGSFKLFAGQDTQAGAGAELHGVGLGASGQASRKRVTLREAGSALACLSATPEAPPAQCASPIQLFLEPLRPGAVAAPGAPNATVSSDDPSTSGVHVAFPLPEDEDESWSLRDRTGKVLCALPCSAWVPPASGYYLQRERPRAELRLPLSLPHRPGTEVTAEYQLGRGQPGFSTWVFYLVGIPSAAMGTGFATWAIVQASTGCEKDEFTGEEDCFPETGFLVTAAVMYLAIGGASFWWYSYSREERFDTYERLGSTASPLQFGLAPSGLELRF